MDIHISLVVLLIFVSCSTTQRLGDSKNLIGYNIVETYHKVDHDTTIIIHELRFYNILSALDATKLMYENYGHWSNKGTGTYQENIHSFTWNNVALLENEKPFIIITDGTETGTEFFACITVFDSNNRDCFSKDHPLRTKLVELFVTKMMALDNNKKVYQLFR